MYFPIAVDLADQGAAAVSLASIGDFVVAVFPLRTKHVAREVAAVSLATLALWDDVDGGLLQDVGSIPPRSQSAPACNPAFRFIRDIFRRQTCHANTAVEFGRVYQLQHGEVKISAVSF